MTQPRAIASFDLTNRCALRCEHCYFYDAEVADELADDAYLGRLQQLKVEYAIRSAFWVGGEPLLRTELLRAATRLFPRNAVATSGLVPIPADLRCGWLVSLDGAQLEHDRLRGAGTYTRVLNNVARLTPRSFALSTTLTAATLTAIDTLPTLVRDTGALGVLIGFYVGPASDKLTLTKVQRDVAIDRLLALKAAGPELLLNSVAGLEILRSTKSSALASSCIYRDQAIAFNASLDRKKPCTFGERANCAACGCPVVAEQHARSLGHPSAEGLLRRLFPRTN